MQCLGCFEEFGDEYSVCPFCGYEVGTPAKEAYHMVPGSLLSGRYRIGRSIGYGGFGVTYIAYDEVMKRKVAIKEYLPSEFSTRIPGHTEVTVYDGERTEQFSSGLSKFVSEAKMLAKVQQTNGVVQIYDSIEGNSTAYIIMEYLEGKNLKEFIDEKGKISVEDAKNILYPIIEALKSIHAMGILHRDIAPDNIFLTNDGKVKLLDFGASRFATTSHSKSLSVIIKQGYAPIEQYRSRGDQGPWTDVYSLAATFYKLITGITPEDSMERVEKEELKRPSKLGVNIPKNTENALINALNIMPEDRTKSMDELEEQLFSEGKVKSAYKKVKKADVGKWPVWAKVAVSAAALMVACFATLLATGIIDYSRLLPDKFVIAEGQARVPNIVNEDSESAENLLASNNLKMLIVDKQYAEFIPKGMVISQSIKKGKIVDEQGIVEVVISAGKETFPLPNVVGYTLEDATNALSNCGVIFTTSESYGEAAPGTVLSQSIAAGELVSRGDSIELVISKGYDTYIDENQEISIPDFVGKSYEEACKLAEKYGLYIKRGVSTATTGKQNTVNEQSPKAGTTGHQGDTVTVYVREEETIVYVPDVQYKNEADAIAALENAGMTVSCTYEESAQVAQGKVISQSVEAGQRVTKENKNVTLVVSLGTEEINKVVASWSEWGDLPSGINKNDYEIEERVQYSFRDKVTTSSREASLAGWEQYNKETVRGEYGNWSAWSTESPAANSDREINSKTQYSYSDYETTSQVDNETLSGWDFVSKDPFYKEDWGGWSDWSESAVSASDSRQVNTKVQYQYSDKEYTTSSSSSLEGWTQYNSESYWGNWSGWQDSQVYASSTREVQNQTVDDYNNPIKKTQYNYSRYYVFNQLDNKYHFGPSYSSLTSCVGTIKGPEESGWSDTPQSISGHVKGNTYDNDVYGDLWFNETTRQVDTGSYNKKTQYRYRDLINNYYYFRWLPWSAWSDTPESPNDNRQVQTRTLYQYSDRPVHYTCNFGRWSAFSDYSDSTVSESATRRVQTRDIYQYRDRENYNIYYYYQWGGWSDYRDEAVEKTDSREVQTRTLYRYKHK